MDIKIDLNIYLKKLHDSYNKYPRFKVFRKIRKCSYVLAAIKIDLFKNNGAVQITNGIYLLERKYDGTSTGETSAVIGLCKYYVRSLINKDNSIYDVIKSCPLLKNVPGIENLSPYRLNILKFLLKYLYFIYDDELILFNIEPKGNKYLELLYPTANICLPGGGLKDQDGFSWEVCAKREFYEEVGFRVPENNSENLKLITKQKVTSIDRQSMYFIWRIKNFL